jgi:hypothetical protein
MKRSGFDHAHTYYIFLPSVTSQRHTTVNSSCNASSYLAIKLIHVDKLSDAGVDNMTCHPFVANGLCSSVYSDIFFFEGILIDTNKGSFGRAFPSASPLAFTEALPNP